MGNKKRIYLIINPASGKQESILKPINNFFHTNRYDWDAGITKGAGDARKMAVDAVKLGYDSIIAYGGDGTVSEVARGMINTGVPLLIIPGGTANVLAKDLGIPQNFIEALELLLKGKVRSMDTYNVNGEAGILRLSTGYFAESIAETNRKQKDRYGIMAYSIQMLQKPLEEKYYLIETNGRKREEKAIGLMVTNAASVGLFKFVIHPDISLFDRQLDLVVINNTDLDMLAKVAKSAVLGDSDLQVEKIKNIRITVPGGDMVLLDDEKYVADELEIMVNPESLKVYMADDH